ncbi:MAG TPA: hypothetical protein VJA23_03895 [Candidatus Nanoarchaeia archaeon]|nr:hypothetical protein [Candidatus Nanoarchaeia archaeon]
MVKKREMKRVIAGVVSKSKVKKKSVLCRNRFKLKKSRKSSRKDKSSKVRKLIKLAKARQKFKPQKKKFWSFRK